MVKDNCNEFEFHLVFISSCQFTCIFTGQVVSYLQLLAAVVCSLCNITDEGVLCL